MDGQTSLIFCMYCSVFLNSQSQCSFLHAPWFFFPLPGPSSKRITYLTHSPTPISIFAPPYPPGNSSWDIAKTFKWNCFLFPLTCLKKKKQLKTFGSLWEFFSSLDTRPLSFIVVLINSWLWFGLWLQLLVLPLNPAYCALWLTVLLKVLVLAIK